ncbi:MAG: DUF4129 domain-containing protein [Spirosoma sp.]|nr:DUF4129 domain-containing protein [Spirosoma sp.]
MKANIRFFLGHRDAQRRHRVSQRAKRGKKTSAAPAYRYLCASLCISVAQNLLAQANEPVTVRYPDAEKLRDLQTDRAYQYGTDAPPPDNPIARFLAYLWQKIAEFLVSDAYQNVWQYVFLAAIAGLAVYLLLKAEMLGSLFAKRAQQSDGLDYETITENIHEIDFDAAISSAVEQQNYRLAVRLLYLQTLKRLTDAELIQYKPDKTNRQYVYELANSPQQSDFEQLTRQFEFVWYGDFPVDAGRFDTLRAQFRAFAGSLAIAR